MEGGGARGVMLAHDYNMAGIFSIRHNGVYNIYTITLNSV